MLLSGRAFIDAGRALAVWTAMQMDIAARHPDAGVRAAADGLVALMTPVIKAAFSDFGFETAVISQQVFGGHGYIRETGMEQYVRDARITQICKGTNGVQAMDLVTRKLPMEGGELPHRFFSLVRDDLRTASRIAGTGETIARSATHSGDWNRSRVTCRIRPAMRHDQGLPRPTTCACSRSSPWGGCGLASPRE
ncbi:MAG: acyl-CoA dehydrogenase family protein [Pseudomonadota bacterium]